MRMNQHHSGSPCLGGNPGTDTAPPGNPQSPGPKCPPLPSNTNSMSEAGRTFPSGPADEDGVQGRAVNRTESKSLRTGSQCPQDSEWKMCVLRLLRYTEVLSWLCALGKSPPFRISISLSFTSCIVSYLPPSLPPSLLFPPPSPPFLSHGRQTAYR